MASDHETVNITEKRLTVEVLELYKDFPCLWDKSHKLYCNKDARNQALDIILEKWKTCYPRATIDDVKKKIEHLRAGYRRERNKVESSKSTGAGLEDVHTPSLWYYPYLIFLDEKTMPTSQGIDNIGNSDSNSEEPATKKEKSSIKRQNSLYKKQEELIQSATQLIKESSSGEETSADAFGHSVGSQLKELPKLQRCIVEKLIGELLFYAKLGELTVDASINLNRNIHSQTSTHSYYTQPYRSHLYEQHSLASSPSPQHFSPYQPSPSPQHSQPLPSPQHLQPSQSLRHSGTHSYYPQPYRSHVYEQHSLPSSPSPQHFSPYQPSPSPQHSRPSPSPQYLQPSQSPQHSQPSPSPQHLQPSQSPQHSQPSPTPQHLQPSPTPQHSEPSPSPQHLQPSQSPQHSHPSPYRLSPQSQHSHKLSSPHHLQHSSSSRQQSTPSLSQTSAIYSEDLHSQYLPLSQISLPNDFSETITITTDTLSELIPSEETQLNVPNTRAIESSNSEITRAVFRGKGTQLQNFLIFKK